MNRRRGGCVPQSEYSCQYQSIQRPGIAIIAIERVRITHCSITYMLVDEQDGDILSLLREAVECFFDRRGLRLRVYDQKVSLRVRAICDVLQRRVSCWSHAANVLRFGHFRVTRTPIPARRSPVTELHVLGVQSVRE